MKNVTNEEKVKWLKGNCFCFRRQSIDLSGLDFRNTNLNFNGIKARTINNKDQEADKIYNSKMKARDICNGYQEATDTISNFTQKAERTIYNTYQQAGKSILNKDQKVGKHLEAKTKKELIKIINSMNRERS